MLEAMIKKKGEAARGALARLKAWRVGARLNSGLALVLHGCCVSCPSLPFARKALCGKAGQPRARKAVAWAWSGAVGCLGAHREDCGVQRAFSQGALCLKLCVPFWDLQLVLEESVGSNSSAYQE